MDGKFISIYIAREWSF